MTGPKGNSEFCIPEALNVPRGEVFCKTSQLKTKKNCEKIVPFYAGWLINWRSFREHDLITCESKVQVVVSLVN